MNGSQLKVENIHAELLLLKNGQYVTHVVAGGIIVEEPIIPLSMSFTSIKSGDTYKASTQIPVNIKLSGDLSDADEVQFLVREENDNWSVKHTATVNGTSDYSYNWIPSESGIYSLRVTAGEKWKLCYAYCYWGC